MGDRRQLELIRLGINPLIYSDAVMFVKKIDTRFSKRNLEINNDIIQDK
jgi:hypothetical protein